MINVARASMNRISAKPTVTSGLDLRDLGFSMTPSNPTARRACRSSPSPASSRTGDAQQPFATRVNNVVRSSPTISTWVRRQALDEVRRRAAARSDQGRRSSTGPNGDFTFAGTQYTGNAAADFLLGFPTQYRQATGDPNLDGIVVGLRRSTGRTSSASRRAHAELRRPLRGEPAVRREAAITLNAFHPGQQSTRVPDRAARPRLPGRRGRAARHLSDRQEQRRAAARPRSGTCAATAGRAVRGAWGLFYDTLPGQGDFFQNGTLAPPFQPLTEVNFPLQHDDAAVREPAGRRHRRRPASRPASSSSAGASEFATPVGAALQPHGAAAGRRPTGASRSGYVGSRGKNLPIFMEVNPTIPILSPAPAIGPRLFPAFSLVRPTFSEAESWYDSLQASARMRPWRGLNFLASYTLGHAVDHVSGLNIGGEPRPMLPVTIGDQASIDAALAREKGDALFDVRHRFVLSFGYELPRLDDRGAADAARPRRLAGERHHPGADRVPADRHRADQRLADVADQPAEHDLRSERGRARAPRRSGSTPRASSA